MIITRQKKVPYSWISLAHLPWAAMLFASAASTIIFALEIRKFTANPAAIGALLMFNGVLTMLVSPIVNWLSDKLWTRWGRRKIFYVPAVFCQGILILMIPLTTSLAGLVVIYVLQFVALSCKAPNQSLNQEIVPSHQRGRAGVFNRIYVQLGLMAYNVALIGRFDDVLPNSPISGFFGSITGEMLIFVVFALALVSVVLLVGLGIKEIRPKAITTIRDDLDGNVTLPRIAKRLFLDVFSKQLWPVYLVKLSQALYGVALGGMVALMFTEQWGYSTQVLGFTQGVGQFVSLFVLVLLFPVVDRYDKLKFYLVAVSLGLASKLAWYFYVMYWVPNQRPSIFELIVIGEGIHMVSLLAVLIVYPLVYEFVPLKIMGTANAGMELARGFFEMVLGALLGVWLLVFSNLFMPAAGSSVVTVLEQPVNISQMETWAEEWEEQQGREIWVEPYQPFGVDTETSQQWSIRIQDDTSEAIQTEIDAIEEKLAEVQNRIDSRVLQEAPIPPEWIEQKAQLVGDLESAKARQLARAMDFHEFLAARMEGDLASLRQGIAEVSVDGRTVRIDGRAAFPIDEESTEEFARQLGLKLNWGLGTVSIETAPGDPERFTLSGTVPADFEPDEAPRRSIAERVFELLRDDELSAEMENAAAAFASAAAEVVAGSRNAVLMPFPDVDYAPHKVDYFSAYLFMAFTDIFAIMIAVLLIRAERAGKITRRGKLEDEAANEPSGDAPHSAPSRS